MNLIPAIFRSARRASAIAIAAVVAASALLCAPSAEAKKLNDDLLNRPYADLRRFHLGFSVGLNMFGLSMHHNGFVTAEGQTWFMEQPSYNPGFCVTALGELRLNTYFSLRVSPGLWFGNRVVKFLDTNSGQEERQNLKSAYVVLPVELKFASQRLRNIRPYVIGGVIPAFDVTKKSSDFLQLKSTDFMLSVGFGCDIYLPFFKLNPEIKFCYGLTDCINHNRPDHVDNPLATNINASLKRATTKMIVLSFYFE